MSGIAGIINFNGKPIAPEVIGAMTGAMEYRGPDGIHHWLQEAESGVVLGHCLLRTTPESMEEQQPVVSDDGSLVLVMDGRVDNWVELRHRLVSKGVVLRNRSDPELVLAAYRCWGEACLDYMDGDFAFAIWHPESRHLFCARDHLGGKPFHYHFSGNQLVFASDIHAVLGVPGVPEVANDGLIAECLAFDWQTRNETFWRDVLSLVAAHSMRVSAQGPVTRCYWSPALFATLDYRRDEDYVEHYRELLEDTVRRQLRSQNRVSIEVSGGLDSSAIFAMAGQLISGGQANTPGIEGYTLNFEGYEDADEIAWARAVADHVGSVVHEIAPAWLPLDWYANKCAAFRDIIGYPNLVMAANELQAVADSGSRVLLDGTGGDEWLGTQGFSFKEAMFLLGPREFGHLLSESVSDEGLRYTFSRMVRAMGSLILPEYLVDRIRNRLDSNRDAFDGVAWLAPGLQSQLLSRRARQRQCNPERCRLPGQQAGLTTLRDAFLAKNHIINERYAATFGLESRRPFYTKAMVQFSFVLPERLKYRASMNKFTHRQAMQGLLPDRVLQRTTKAGFAVTFDRYLADLGESLSCDIPLQRPSWVNQYQAARLYSLYLSGAHEGHPSWALWSLLACNAIFSKT